MGGDVVADTPAPALRRAMRSPTCLLENRAYSPENF